MGTCTSIIPIISTECKEPVKQSESDTYQSMATSDLFFGNKTIEELEQIIEAYIMDEYYERCAGIKRAIELYKKFG